MHVVKILVTVLLCAAVCLPGNRVFMEEVPSPENDFLMYDEDDEEDTGTGDQEAAEDPEGGYDPTGGVTSGS